MSKIAAGPTQTIVDFASLDGDSIVSIQRGIGENRNSWNGGES